MGGYRPLLLTERALLLFGLVSNQGYSRLEFSAECGQHSVMILQANRHALVGLAFLVLVFVGGIVAACADNGPTEVSLRFGQIGEMTVTVTAPLAFGEGRGELQQILTWGSTGPWVLKELIEYRSLPGDETLIRSEGDPRAYASAYASLITQLHQTEGARIFGVVAPELTEPCLPGLSVVDFTVWDEPSQSEITWTRCTQGSLGTLSISEAGPDLEAGRVIQATILVREFTQGPGFSSAYLGSIPFGTLDRGEDSGARLEQPRVFLSVPAGSSKAPTGWVSFWQSHQENLVALPPEVDWSQEMVLVAAVGVRSEAGDSIEVRRVLQTGESTQVSLFERIPGDFCSPASKNHYPFHIVVAPRTREPIRFSEVVTERVPCGF